MQNSLCTVFLAYTLAFTFNVVNSEKEKRKTTVLWILNEMLTIYSFFLLPFSFFEDVFIFVCVSSDCAL